MQTHRNTEMIGLFSFSVSLSISAETLLLVILIVVTVPMVVVVCAHRRPGHLEIVFNETNGKASTNKRIDTIRPNTDSSLSG